MNRSDLPFVVPLTSTFQHVFASDLAELQSLQLAAQPPPLPAAPQPLPVEGDATSSGSTVPTAKGKGQAASAAGAAGKAAAATGKGKPSAAPPPEIVAPSLTPPPMTSSQPAAEDPWCAQANAAAKRAAQLHAEAVPVLNWIDQRTQLFNSKEASHFLIEELVGEWDTTRPSVIPEPVIDAARMAQDDLDRLSRVYGYRAPRGLHEVGKVLPSEMPAPKQEIARRLEAHGDYAGGRSTPPPVHPGDLAVHRRQVPLSYSTTAPRTPGNDHTHPDGGDAQPLGSEEAAGDGTGQQHSSPQKRQQLEPSPPIGNRTTKKHGQPGSHMGRNKTISGGSADFDMTQTSFGNDSAEDGGGTSPGNNSPTHPRKAAAPRAANETQAAGNLTIVARAMAVTNALEVSKTCITFSDCTPYVEVSDTIRVWNRDTSSRRLRVELSDRSASCLFHCEVITPNHTPSKPLISGGDIQIRVFFKPLTAGTASVSLRIGHARDVNCPDAETNAYAQWQLVEVPCEGTANPPSLQLSGQCIDAVNVISFQPCLLGGCRMVVLPGVNPGCSGLMRLRTTHPDVFTVSPSEFVLGQREAATITVEYCPFEAPVLTNGGEDAREAMMLEGELIVETFTVDLDGQPVSADAPPLPEKAQKLLDHTNHSKALCGGTKRTHNHSNSPHKGAQSTKSGPPPSGLLVPCHQQRYGLRGLAVVPDVRLLSVGSTAVDSERRILEGGPDDAAAGAGVVVPYVTLTDACQGYTSVRGMQVQNRGALPLDAKWVWSINDPAACSVRVLPAALSLQPDTVHDFRLEVACHSAAQPRAIEILLSLEVLDLPLLAATRTRKFGPVKINTTSQSAIISSSAAIIKSSAGVGDPTEDPRGRLVVTADPLGAFSSIQFETAASDHRGGGADDESSDDFSPRSRMTPTKAAVVPCMVRVIADPQASAATVAPTRIATTVPTLVGLANRREILITNPCPRDLHFKMNPPRGIDHPRQLALATVEEQQARATRAAMLQELAAGRPNGSPDTATLNSLAAMDQHGFDECDLTFYPARGVLKGGATTTVAFTFTLKRPGRVDVDLECYVEEMPSSLFVQLVADGMGPTATVSTSMIEYGIVPFGGEAEGRFTVSNFSPVPLVFTVRDSHRHDDTSIITLDASADAVPERFLFLPDKGLLKPKQSVEVTAYFRGVVHGALKDAIEVCSLDGPVTYIEVRGDVQRPAAALSTHLVDVGVVNRAVPKTGWVTIFNVAGVDIEYEVRVIHIPLMARGLAGGSTPAAGASAASVVPRMLEASPSRSLGGSFALQVSEPPTPALNIDVLQNASGVLYVGGSCDISFVATFFGEQPAVGAVAIVSPQLAEPLVFEVTCADVLPLRLSVAVATDAAPRAPMPPWRYMEALVTQWAFDAVDVVGMRAAERDGGDIAATTPLRSLSSVSSQLTASQQECVPLVNPVELTAVIPPDAPYARITAMITLKNESGCYSDMKVHVGRYVEPVESVNDGGLTGEGLDVLQAAESSVAQKGAGGVAVSLSSVKAQGTTKSLPALDGTGAKVTSAALKEATARSSQRGSAKDSGEKKFRLALSSGTQGKTFVCKELDGTQRRDAIVKRHLSRAQAMLYSGKGLGIEIVAEEGPSESSPQRSSAVTTLVPLLIGTRTADEPHVAIDPFQEISLRCAAYANLPGQYRDFIEIACEGAPVLKLPVTLNVRGAPLVLDPSTAGLVKDPKTGFTKLSMPSMVPGMNAVQRRVLVTSRCPRDVQCIAKVTGWSRLLQADVWVDAGSNVDPTHLPRVRVYLAGNSGEVEPTSAPSEYMTTTHHHHAVVASGSVTPNQFLLPALLSREVVIDYVCPPDQRDTWRATLELLPLMPTQPTSHNDKFLIDDFYATEGAKYIADFLQQQNRSSTGGSASSPTPSSSSSALAGGRGIVASAFKRVVPPASLVEKPGVAVRGVRKLGVRVPLVSRRGVCLDGVVLPPSEEVATLMRIAQANSMAKSLEVSRLAGLGADAALSAAPRAGMADLDAALDGDDEDDKDEAAAEKAHDPAFEERQKRQRQAMLATEKERQHLVSYMAQRRSEMYAFSADYFTPILVDLTVEVCRPQLLSDPDSGVLLFPIARNAIATTRMIRLMNRGLAPLDFRVEASAPFVIQDGRFLANDGRSQIPKPLRAAAVSSNHAIAIKSDGAAAGGGGGGQGKGDSGGITPKGTVSMAATKASSQRQPLKSAGAGIAAHHPGTTDPSTTLYRLGCNDELSLVIELPAGCAQGNERHAIHGDLLVKYSNGEVQTFKLDAAMQTPSVITEPGHLVFLPSVQVAKGKAQPAYCKVLKLSNSSDCDAPFTIRHVASERPLSRSAGLDPRVSAANRVLATISTTQSATVHRDAATVLMGRSRDDSRDGLISADGGGDVSVILDDPDRFEITTRSGVVPAASAGGVPGTLELPVYFRERASNVYESAFEILVEGGIGSTFVLRGESRVTEVAN